MRERKNDCSKSWFEGPDGIQKYAERVSEENPYFENYAKKMLPAARHILSHDPTLSSDMHAVLAYQILRYEAILAGRLQEFLADEHRQTLEFIEQKRKEYETSTINER
jgi:hypothetical protein